MKRRSIGDITRGGGFSGAIREANASGEPLFITRGNESVAVLFPSSPEFEHLMIMIQGFMDVVKKLRREGLGSEASEFIAMNIAVGAAAQMIWATEGHGEAVTTLMDKVSRRFASFAQNRTEDRATLGSDPSAVPVEGKSRRRKPAASPKQSPPRKR